MSAAKSSIVGRWYDQVGARLNPRGKQASHKIASESSFALTPRVSARMLLAIGLIIGALGVAFTASESNEQARLASIAALLARFEQANAHWTNDVLGVQLGVLPNYDRLAAPFYGLQKSRDELGQATQTQLSLPAADQQQVNETIRALGTTLMQKVDLAGKIAARFAILNNSERALSVSIDATLNTLEKAQLPVVVASHVIDLTARIAVLVYDPQQESMPAALGELEALAPSLPENLQSEVRAVIIHATTILSQRGRMRQLAAQMQERPVSASARALQHVFTTHRERLLQRESLYRGVVVVLIALLAGSLALVAWQLRGTARKISENYERLRGEQAELEAQLVQSSKLASLGQMVAGIAHEINTPLAYLRATIEMLQQLLTGAIEAASDERGFGEKLQQRSPQGDASLYDDIRSLLSDGVYGTERISEFVRSLKNFSRRDDASVGVFSLAELADSALVLSTHVTKQIAQVRREFDTAPKVRCAPSQIVQVLLNLINNSLQAMEGLDGKGVLAVTVVAVKGDMVRIDVADNGVGIPPDVVPRVLEPFFSTKRLGEGTGLGLAICNKIIKAHSGQLAIKSTVGVGTTMSILLPVALPRPEAGNANLDQFASQA